MSNKINPPVLEKAREMYRQISGNKQVKEYEGEISLSKFLLNTFHVGDFFFLIYYLPEQEMEYCSDGTQRLLSINPSNFTLQYMVENIHPDDLPTFMHFEKTMLHFLPTLPPDKLTSYKVVYDYRMKGSDGTFKRVLHQLMTLQNDDNGAVIRTFGVFTDITHLKSSTRMQLNVIGMNGEPSFFNIQEDLSYTSGDSPLTDRETQVLSLMAQGNSSSEIAAKLEIAKNTVDNHRKHILRKTESQTSTQAMKKALEGHWI